MKLSWGWSRTQFSSQPDSSSPPWLVFISSLGAEEGGVGRVPVFFATCLYEALKSGGQLGPLLCLLLYWDTPAKDPFLGSRSRRALLVP